MLSFFQNKIYHRLPVFLQNVAISFYGLTWMKRRLGGRFNSFLSDYKSREQYSEEEWYAYQEHRLRSLLVHAFNTVPYYNKVLSDAGLDSETLASFSLNKLSTLPMLQKQTLREQGSSALLSSRLEPGGAFFSSSGSTGTPVRLLFSERMHQEWSAAFEARIRHWAGVTYSDPRGMIGGRMVVHSSQTSGPFYRYNYAEKQTYFSITHLSRQHAADYVDGLVKNKVRYLTGYAISISLLANYINELGISMPPLKAVITSSEKLTPQMRVSIRLAFGCKTYDSWSGIEACGLISECEHGRLHMSPDLGILEVLDETGKPVAPGEIGEVVCTGLLNYDQPLIRYRIGDMVRLGADQHCPCGRHMPVVEEIVGRIDDVVTLKDGRQLSSFNRFFADISGIQEVQVVQTDYSRFELNLVPAAGYSARTEEAIRKMFQDKLGPVDLSINLIDRIPRNSNGKFRAVVSNLKQ